MKKFLLFFTILCVVVSGGMAIALIQRQRDSSFAIFSVVIDDAAPIQVEGQFARVQDVLNTAGIWLRPVDLITPDVLSVPDAQRPIIINRAREIDVVLPSGRTLYFTHQPTLGAFLAEANITVRANTTVLADGLPIAFGQINALRLPEVVMITQPDRTAQTAAQTPVLAVTVLPQTTPLPTAPPSQPTPLPTPVPTQASAAAYPAGSYPVAQPENPISNAQYEDVELPFETIWEASEQFELDTTGVVMAGQPGILRREFGADGALLREFVFREPITQINGYGTRLVIRTLTTDDGETHDYWRKVEMRVTSYTAATSGKARSDPWYGITASGVQAGYGVVAVDRAIVPWRSWIYVPGYGKGYVGDVGGGIIGRWIDLGYDEDAFEWWSGFSDVYFLTPVPEPERINYLLPQELPPLPGR